jgi:hypothetical protein
MPTYYKYNWQLPSHEMTHLRSSAPSLSHTHIKLLQINVNINTKMLIFMFFVPCTVIQLCNFNNQNAPFKLIFQFTPSCLLHVPNVVCSSSETLYSIVHAALHGMFFKHLHARPSTCQAVCIITWKTCHVRLHVQYSVPDDERKLFKTYIRQEESN